MPRLFVGVELDEDVKRRAADAAAALRTRLEPTRINARWVPEENLHITLWFIGNVDDDRAGRIRTALGAPIPVSPFSIQLAGAGAFPPSGPPRVLWLGVRDGAAGMASLYAAIRERMLALGFEEERRGYTAHVTIARVKEIARPAARAARETIAAADAECGTSHVTAATLFLSRLSPKGSQYEPLLRIPLS